MRLNYLYLIPLIFSCETSTLEEPAILRNISVITKHLEDMEKELKVCSLNQDAIKLETIHQQFIKMIDNILFLQIENRNIGQIPSYPYIKQHAQYKINYYKSYNSLKDINDKIKCIQFYMHLFNQGLFCDSYLYLTDSLIFPIIIKAYEESLNKEDIKNDLETLNIKYILDHIKAVSLVHVLTLLNEITNKVASNTPIPEHPSIEKTLEILTSRVEEGEKEILPTLKEEYRQIVSLLLSNLKNITTKENGEAKYLIRSYLYIIYYTEQLLEILKNSL